MHQRSIDLQTWADIHDGLDVRGRTDTGFALITAGNHPALGTVIAIQDACEGVILRSERPLPAFLLATPIQAPCR